MGGRGVKGLPVAHPNPGGSNRDEDGWSIAPDFRSYATLKEAMGKKGSRMGIEEASKGANPYFNDSYREFSENCQRVVVAYEARRRGYNVTAQPTYKNDRLPRRAYGNNSYYYGAFQKAKVYEVPGTTAKSMQKNFEDRVKKYGRFSRSTLSYKWKNENSGHVINVEVHRGKVLYIDAQQGVRYRGSELFKNMEVGTVRTARIDNLRFSERAKKSIEPAKRRTRIKG